MYEYKSQNLCTGGKQIKNYIQLKKIRALKRFFQQFCWKTLFLVEDLEYFFFKYPCISGYLGADFFGPSFFSSRNIKIDLKKQIFFFLSRDPKFFSFYWTIFVRNVFKRYVILGFFFVKNARFSVQRSLIFSDFFSLKIPFLKQWILIRRSLKKLRKQGYWALRP